MAISVISGILFACKFLSEVACISGFGFSSSLSSLSTLQELLFDELSELLFVLKVGLLFVLSLSVELNLVS